MKNYTVVKVKFNHQGVICEHIDLGLKPMTEKEAVTFKSKMMKPYESIRPDHVVFYHGSSTSCGITDMICPPVDTNVISEKGRNKNLDRVFFTADMGLARIYAGRAARSIGGEPVLFRVVCPVDVVEMNTTPGASVYHAAWAFVEQIQ